MARPRVFVSSTYYDLKYIRASLGLFIDSLGFDPVLSEKGDIAYMYDRPLDASCYREAEGSDIFVLIIGGRYGAEVSGGAGTSSRQFFDRYESITKKEYESAASRGVPTFVLIERSVHSEYQTFQRNKENADIAYAHVDSVNVFLFIEDILSRPRNNPVQSFEKFDDIERWLREQWAGLFRELLQRQSEQQQLASLTGQVAELKAVNETLKTYLEAVMKGTNEKEASKLIESEEKRLDDIRRLERLRQSELIQGLTKAGMTEEAVFKAIAEAKNPTDFAKRLEPFVRGFDLTDYPFLMDAFNGARILLGAEPFK